MWTLITAKNAKAGDSYIARLTVKPDPAALYNHRKWQLIGKSQCTGT